MGGWITSETGQERHETLEQAVRLTAGRKRTASNTVDGGIEDSWRQGQCDDDGADGQTGRRAGGVV